MLKIIVLADTFAPNIGGSEYTLSVLVKGLGEKGYQVSVFTPTSRNPMDSYIPPQNVIVYRSKVWKYLQGKGASKNRFVNRLSRYLLLIFLYFKLLPQKTDVAILGHILPLGIIVQAMKRFGRCKKSYIITYGEEVSMYRRGRNMSKLLLSALKNADAVSCLTNDSRLELEEILPGISSKVTILPPSVEILDESLINNDNPKLIGSPILFTVSRIVERKGMDRTIDALKLINKEFPEIHYYIAGVGEYRASLEDQVKKLGLEKHVTFLGKISNINEYFRAADIFCMPNRTLSTGEREGFGIVFLEAALQKLPSIAGNSGGAPDAVLDGQTGFVVDPNSPQEIEDAIKKLALDRDLGMRMGEAAYQHAKQFTPTRYVDTTEGIINKILAENK